MESIVLSASRRAVTALQQLIAFPMEKKDSEDRSIASLFTVAFVVWKPSEVKTHVRPEVDRPGEGDWGTK